MSRLTAIDPPGLARVARGWSQVVVANQLVFVSGQGAWDERGEVVGRGSVTEAEVAFDHLDRALVAAGSGRDRLVKLTVFLVDDDHIAPFRRVRDRFSEICDRRPPWSWCAHSWTRPCSSRSRRLPPPPNGIPDEAGGARG